METALNSFEVFARGAAGAVLNGLWQGFVLLILVWLLLRLNGRLNAATRYLVWCATLALVVCLPFAAANFAGSDRAATSQVHTRDGHAATTDAGQERGRVSLVELTLPASLFGGWWAAILVCAWVLASALMTARVLRSYASLRRVKRGATPLGGRHQLELDRLRAVHGVRRKVVLLSSKEISVPLLAGLRGAAILIPEGLLGRLSDSEFEQVVLHELAHARRRDDWTKFAQRLAEALFFFHPAVWWLGPRLDMEREVACDDWVISLTGQRRQYALCLVRLAELLAAPHAPSVAPGVVRARRQVTRRIELLLDKMRNTKPHPSPLYSAALLVLLTAAAFQCARSLPVIGLKASTHPRRESNAVAQARTTHLAEQQAATGAPADAATGDAQEADEVNGGGRGRAADAEADGRIVQQSMRPGLREIERQHSAAVSARISAIDRKAHALLGEEMHEIMRLGEAESEPQKRALERKMKEKLGDEMRELESYVSANIVPRVGELDARARRAAAESGDEATR
ncbi:MAG: M56 family metallopeptidase [Pyrinomonadaceae bacterium]